MRRYVIFCAVLAVAFGAAADTTKDKLMELPGASGSRTPCPPITATISCGDTIAVDTTGSVNTMSAYSCTAWDETGPENVYELTLPAGGPYDVNVSSANMAGGDLDFFILTAPCDSDNCLAYGDSGANASAVAGGTTLFVSVDGYSGSSGTVDLTVDCIESLPPPTNEDCATATEVLALPFSEIVDTSLAMANQPGASCGGATTEMQNDVWYGWLVTLDCDIDVAIDDSVGGGYDMVAAAYSGDCGALTEFTCMDDPEPYAFTINAVAGTVYYVRTGDYGTSPGGGLVQVDFSTNTPGGCGLIPVPVELMTFSVE